MTEKKSEKYQDGIWFQAFWLNSRKSGSTKRGEGGRQQRLTGLTLHPLFPLAFLFVLLLEFGYQARVHIPGLRNGTLLVLLYTGGQNQTKRLLRNCPVAWPQWPGRVGKVQSALSGSYSPGGFSNSDTVDILQAKSSTVPLLLPVPRRNKYCHVFRTHISPTYLI